MSATPGEIAAQLLERALDEVRSGVDAIPVTEAALIALRIEAGEHPANELADLDEFAFGAKCTCPPDLRARGGWSSRCRAEH